MFIACDESGHTGPDLLAKDQQYFAFSSVNISNEEAWEIISKARQAHPVQMPELKASKLMRSNRGQRLVAHIIEQIDGRFAINAHNKLVALCGWVFEYIFEPVYKDDPRVFYRKDFHRFIAMFCFLWFQDQRSEAKLALSQFQAFMRSKDTSDAPVLFEFKGGPISENANPFELIQRFATGHREKIGTDVADIEDQTSDRGTWTLDLSASGLWSHLNHWGKERTPLAVVCDDSKPLRAIKADFERVGHETLLKYAKYKFGHDGLGWEFEKPIEFVDSRAHPSIQLADILASTSVHIFSNGLPEGMQDTGEIMQRGMLLKDSIFPDFERVNLENDTVKVHNAVLFELAATAEGHGTGVPVEAFFKMAERGVASGEI